MKTIRMICIIALAILTTNCGDDGTAFNFQSDRCNDGDQGTLSLSITGVGFFNFSESSSAISHATDTEGSGVDAIVFYFRWKDPVTGDSIIYDITVENEELAVATYDYNAGNFNGTVNFYIYKTGLLDAHYTFTNWTTSIDEYEEFTTTSGGGFTNKKLAYVRGSTAGMLTEVGAGGSYNFTSSYTICPRY